ncbi:hypothetical protein [Mesorhizobium sp. M0488]|uniref:hypothetical protein n=1 Tax=unclassified Mesorhizobium TaxID=325217 RepID=UPI00333AF81F
MGGLKHHSPDLGSRFCVDAASKNIAPSLIMERKKSKPPGEIYPEPFTAVIGSPNSRDAITIVEMSDDFTEMETNHVHENPRSFGSHDWSRHVGHGAKRWQ